MKQKRQFLLSITAAAFAAGLSCSKLTAQEVQETPHDTLARTVSKIQDELAIMKKIKISGYIQSQFQWADSAGIKSFAGGDFPVNVDKRFKVRRAEFKIMYDNVKTQIVANIDITQNGVNIKDAYGKINEQKLKMFSLTAGIFNRPFGFECPYSSSMLESPERARVIQTILPGERDLGAMLTFQMPAGSVLHPLKIEGGIFNGSGNNVNDFDWQKDFIGNIHWNSVLKSEKIKYGVGISYYDGGVRQGTSKVFTMSPDSLGVNAFQMNKDTANYGKTAWRHYVGFDGQVSIDFPFGITTLRGEYIMGQQPGTSSTSVSPSAQPGDTYIRNFDGAYFILVQNIMQSKHAIVIKYDWYDPNTKVSGNDLGSSVLKPYGTSFNKTNTQDLKYTTLGLGYIFKLDNNVKFTLYYDMVTNESSKNLPAGGYWRDLKDNVLTARIQYKF
jgi:phosphate-selective porin